MFSTSLETRCLNFSAMGNLRGKMLHSVAATPDVLPIKAMLQFYIRKLFRDRLNMFLRTLALYSLFLKRSFAVK